MADNSNNSKSHVGFFVALLVVVALGAGGYWAYVTYAQPVADQQQTAAQNPGIPHPPKNVDKKPAVPATTAAPEGGK